MSGSQKSKVRAFEEIKAYIKGATSTLTGLDSSDEGTRYEVIATTLERIEKLAKAQKEECAKRRDLISTETLEPEFKLISTVVAGIAAGLLSLVAVTLDIKWVGVFPPIAAVVVSALTSDWIARYRTFGRLDWMRTGGVPGTHFLSLLIPVLLSPYVVNIIPMFYLAVLPPTIAAFSYAWQYKRRTEDLARKRDMKIGMVVPLLLGLACGLYGIYVLWQVSRSV